MNLPRYFDLYGDLAIYLLHPLDDRLVGFKVDGAFYLLTLYKDQIYMYRKLTPPMRTMTRAALAVAFFSTQLFSQSQCDAVAGNLVVNCGFETGSFAPWVVVDSSGNTFVTGSGFSHSGTFALASGPTGAASTVTQNIPTVAGNTYTFSFWQRADGDTNSFAASWNGLPVFIEVNATHGYIQRSFTVVATAASTPIIFSIQNPPTYDFLDDIAVVVLPPDLTVTKIHVGNFSQGQIGATYTLTVNNVGGSATAGTVTLVDILPAGLTATAIADGAGWTCTLATLTCTTTAAVAPGASFPPITLTVNVAPNAPALVTNNVRVSGGGQVNLANDTAADPTVITFVDFFQISYAANLTAGDSVIDITNTGANGASLNGPGFGGATGNICVNVYAFSPDEQLISCCSCLITPNGLVSLSVNQDLVSNTLTGVRPNSIIVKLVNTGATGAFTGTSCTNSAALAGTAPFPLAGGFKSFETTVHAAVPTGFANTETPFLRATLSPAELASITSRCTNIIGNGSTFGICRSCRVGGLNASK